ncbi:hypothetical protein JGU71_12855 [Antrihabitans sp. YC3-6]|uniref:Uncharacterized protein n=1 Tax=Antrihabitans stalagmiti TaxID=2799499 RepID=A0A934NR28_9NOCA|nr:hypothetical protein [Antrihabitans stalagmiti]MBJ8339777.1 hypothetical protein [Antrihabitans stalagmiti]
MTTENGTDDNGSGEPKQISVAELLARNGQQVASAAGGRRRRGTKGGISVAELTGEIPVIRDSSPSGSFHAVLDDEPVDDPEAEARAAAEAKAADERAAQERAAKERDERIARDKAEREKAEREKAERDKAERDKAERDKAAKAQREKAEREKAERDKTERDKTEREKAERDRVAAERADRDNAAAETATAALPAVPKGVERRPGRDSAADLGAPQDKAPDLVKRAEPKTQNPTAWSSAEREPQLLSGSTVAGDLMRGRQSGELDSEFDSDSDTDGSVQLLDDRTPSENTEAATKPERSAARQWLVLLGQAVVAVIAGALMFTGFEKLWDVLPLVALVLSVLVILGLVALVLVLRKTEDILSIVIAVVVGVFVTLGPLAFLLSAR